MTNKIRWTFSATIWPKVNWPLYETLVREMFSMLGIKILATEFIIHPQYTNYEIVTEDFQVIKPIISPRRSD